MTCYFVVIVRNGLSVKIVEAHKPNRDDERARIEALGGSIMHWGTWRVNGQLAVSRAIGEMTEDLKGPSLIY